MRVVLILLILLTLGFSGCMSQSNILEPQTPKYLKCPNGVIVMNLSECKDMPDPCEKTPNYCKAVKNKDPSLCLPNEEGIDEMSCKSSVAVRNNDMSLCATYSQEFADYCYRSIAISRQDPSVCLNIKNQSNVYLRGQCECASNPNEHLLECMAKKGLM